ncbi:DUF4861 family protein [Neptunicella sp. SCSIO 80796]|uniref:DUF4861 family protein n=1 Tax=Neptunicella plasticusilytica TaxID=3117012 RepID=UPI003A4D5AFD
MTINHAAKTCQAGVKLSLLLILASSLPTIAATHKVADLSGHININATNSLNIDRPDSQIRVPLESLYQQLPNARSNAVIAMSGNRPLPSQMLDTNMDGRADTLTILADFSARQTRTLSLYSADTLAPEAIPSNRTHAELAVRVGGRMNDKMRLEGGHYINARQFSIPADHSIGNKVFKYEGIGWESELVAYRFYFDHRSATDVFGKIKPQLALTQVGLDGGNYHSLGDWGMDILKVGPSVGVGAVAGFNHGQIVQLNQFSNAQATINNGPVLASAVLQHSHWQFGDISTDLSSRYAIAPGSRLTEVTARAPGVTQWIAGIVDHQVQRFVSADTDKKWCYLATYGKQSLAKDNLGLGVFYPCRQASGFVKEQQTDAVVLNLGTPPVHYYFFANWSAEQDGAKDQQAFEQFLTDTRSRLNNPILVKLAADQ